MTVYNALVLAREPLTVRIRDALRAAGISCGVAKPPPPPSGQRTPTLPYAILYPLGLGTDGPGYYAPDSTGRFTYQVTSVGEDARQVDGLADDVRAVLVGRTGTGFVTDLDAPGVRVSERWTEGPTSFDYSPPLLSLPELFQFAAQVAA